MNKTYEWRTGRYCVFKNFAHLVFVTKYRKGVFTDAMLDEMRAALQKACKQLSAELLEFGGEVDHLHLMVSVPPTTALCHFVGRLKGASSYAVRKKFGKELKQKLWGKHLWSPSYCVVSCGGAPLEIVKSYIEQQRKPSSTNGVKQSIRERGRFGDRSRRRGRQKG